MTVSSSPAEVWRRVDGFPKYKVSSMGRVYSEFRGGHLMSPQFTHKRYLKVHLQDNGRNQNFYVHKLVALAFLSDCATEGLQINHKNGVRSDNRVENLEWCTASENVRHAYRVLNRRAPAQGRRHTQDEIRRISESNKRTKALRRKGGVNEGA